jgi:propionyl-CoA carboxylase alpha chain
VVGHAYDSLVAKVMAHRPDRAAAVGALALAVRALELDGLETNRDLLAAVLDSADFRAGQVDVHWLENGPDLRDARLDDEARFAHAAAAACALSASRAAASLVPLGVGGWRNVGSAQHADRLADAAGALEAHVAAPGAHVSVRALGVDGPTEPMEPAGWAAAGRALGVTSGGEVELLGTDGLRRRYRVRLAGHLIDVNGPEGQSGFSLSLDDDEGEVRAVAGECRAPLPGSVTKVAVSEGDVVTEGDPLVVLEAMKMEHTLRADGAGTVTQVLCAPGQQVDVNDLLVALAAP